MTSHPTWKIIWIQPDNGDGHRKEGNEPSSIKDYFQSPLVSNWDNNKIIKNIKN